MIHFDIVAPDGSILYRLKPTPVGVAGSDYMDRIEDALREEFENGDSELTIERRADSTPGFLDGVGDPL